MKNNIYDFAIVGAGIIGSLYALNFKKRGFKVVVIDSTLNKVYTPDNFSILLALNKLSVEAINQIDLTLLKQDIDFTNICIWAGDFWNKKLNLSCTDNFEFSLGKMKKQNQLKYELNQCIKQSNIEYSEQKIESINPKQKKLILQNKSQIDFKFCLLANGKNTQWLEKLNFKIKKNNYYQKSLVVEVELKNSHKQTNFQLFNKNYILALLAKDDSKKAQLILHLKSDHPLSNLNQVDQEFKNFIEEALFSSDIQISKFNSTIWATHIEGKQVNYKADNLPIICVGDSYLSIHPLAGQGLNFAIKAQTLFFNSIDKRNINSDNIQMLDDEFINIWLKEFEQSILPFKYLIHSIAKNYISFIPEQWLAMSFLLLSKTPIFKKLIVNYASWLNSMNHLINLK